MGRMFHMSSSIEGLLEQSDKQLASLFQMKGDKVRKELLRRLNKGELYIPSEGCDTFDPKKGCPGHKTPDKETILVQNLEYPSIIRAEPNLLN